MKRPNGSGQIVCGWWCIAIGAIVAISAASMSVTTLGGEIDVDKLVQSRTYLLWGASLTGFGSLLLGIGWIIRALYFLPGRDIDAEQPASE